MRGGSEDGVTLRPAAYGTVPDTRSQAGVGPRLHRDARFRFTTFRVAVAALGKEYPVPAAGQGPVWRGMARWRVVSRCGTMHTTTWLLDDRPGGCLRHLTQETQLRPCPRHGAGPSDRGRMSTGPGIPITSTAAGDRDGRNGR